MSWISVFLEGVEVILGEFSYIPTNSHFRFHSSLINFSPFDEMGVEDFTI